MVTFWLGAAAAVAATTTKEREPIATDRPDFTESARVVGRGTIQWESGLTASRIDGDKELAGPELLIRIGASERFEWRFVVPDRILDSGDSRWGDFAIGAKWQVGPCPDGAEFAIIGEASMPAEDAELEEADFSAKFCVARDISESSSLSTMLDLGLLSASGAESARLGWTLSYSQAAGERESWFLEYAGEFHERSHPLHILHAGWVSQPDPDHQWDFHGGFDLKKGSDSIFFGIGYSVRF